MSWKNHSALCGLVMIGCFQAPGAVSFENTNDAGAMMRPDTRLDASSGFRPTPTRDEGIENTREVDPADALVIGLPDAESPDMQMPDLDARIVDAAAVDVPVIEMDVMVAEPMDMHIPVDMNTPVDMAVVVMADMGGAAGCDEIPCANRSSNGTRFRLSYRFVRWHSDGMHRPDEYRCIRSGTWDGRFGSGPVSFTWTADVIGDQNDPGMAELRETTPDGCETEIRWQGNTLGNADRFSFRLPPGNSSIVWVLTCVDGLPFNGVSFQHGGASLTLTAN